MDDQKNFILAIVLSGFVMLGYWFFFGKPLAEQARVDAASEIASAESTMPTPAAVEIKEPVARETLITDGDRITIDTASLSGSFSLSGSRFDDIRLKNYNQTLEDDSETVIMLTPEGAEKSAYIFDNWTKADSGSGSNSPWMRLSGTTLTETAPIILQHKGDGFVVERTVSVDDKYLITLTDKVTNTSGNEINLRRKGVSRQHGLPDELTNFFIIQEGPISVVDNKLDDMKYKKLRKSGEHNNSGEGGWVGLTDKYWLSAAIAPQGKNISTKFAYREINGQEVYETGYSTTPMTITPGTTIESVGHVFAGPKDRTTLLNYENEVGIMQMERAIDWGAMRILTRPMSTVLTFLGEKIGNYGVGILVLTLIIKIVLFPLFNKQYASQAMMKKVQPKQKKLQALYKDDRMKLQQEMMALYKKEGVNPMAGCLPIIPTIFVFFSLYKTVFINIDLRHAPFFGYIQDLSARDPLSILNGFGLFPWDAAPLGLSFLAIGPLAILYGISMSLIYTLTPQNAGGGEQAEMMAKMMKFMPWMFMFILAPFAAGLLVYWVWNNILSFIQQYYITRKFKVDTPVDQFWRKITGKEKPDAA
ncbi:MAG: membrane protein insertase YidC [Maricaulaceae bacterium]